jgi:tetratricopeptide (TPR) repeat protein
MKKSVSEVPVKSPATPVRPADKSAAALPPPAGPARAFPWYILLTVAVVAIVWTQDLYRSKSPYFPRRAEQFRPPAEREQAEKAAAATLERDPENIAAWSDLAVAHYEQGPSHYLQALENLEKARDLGALDERLFYYAGVMYEAEGLADYAKPDYARFLRHHPDDLEVRLRLANLYYRIGEADKAIEEYSRVIAADPKDPVVAFNLASAYRDRQRWSDGLALMNRIAAENRALPAGANRLLGDLNRGAGDYQKALDNYNAELARSKDDPDLIAALAATYEQMKDLPQALDHWKRVLSLSPKNRPAREKIRVLQRKIRAAERASKR